MFSTDITDSTTGATTHYLHNKPLLSDSNIVWKMTSEAFGVTTHYNGDQTVWNAGLTATGTALLQRIYAIGVDADYITTGTISSRDGTVSIDLDNNTINLKGVTSFSGFATKSGLGTSGYTTINGNNITTGYIRSPLIDPDDPDSGRNFVLNLSNGTLTMKKGSINIGSGKFVVDTSGNLTANSATIKGNLLSITSTDYIKMQDAMVYGGKVVNGTQQQNTGYLGFNQWYITGQAYGTRLAGRGMIALLTPVLGVGAYYNFSQNATIEVGQTKSFTYVSNVSAHLTVSKDVIRDSYDGTDVEVVTDVVLDVDITDTTIQFTKGLMVTE